MKHKLIIDGNAVYELDLKCAAKKAGKKTVKTNKDKNRKTNRTQEPPSKSASHTALALRSPSFSSIRKKKSI